jgi:hypothetical protein
MAMNGAAMGDAIKAAIDGLSGSTNRAQIFEAMGNAIVNYIKANAVVSVAAGIAVSTAGTAAAQTGATTATGTGTIS